MMRCDDEDDDGDGKEEDDDKTVTWATPLKSRVVPGLEMDYQYGMQCQLHLCCICLMLDRFVTFYKQISAVRHDSKSSYVFYVESHIIENVIFNFFLEWSIFDHFQKR